MGTSIQTFIEICQWDTARFLIISDNVFAPLIYYSHFFALIPSFFIGLFIFLRGRGVLANQILFFITTTFSLWVFGDLVLWANEKPVLIMFFWSLLVIIEPIIYAACVYFIYVFITKKDINIKKKFGIAVFLMPTLLFASTKFALLGFDLSNCYRETTEGPLTLYGYGIEIVYILWILFFAIKKSWDATKEEKRQIILITTGIILFLFALASGNIIGSLTENWTLAQAGLFGMPIFIAFLAYMIVKFKAFNIKLLGAQALVSALGLLVLAILFIRRIENVKVVVILTLLFVIALGYALIKSVKAEVRHKEELAVANVALQRMDQAKNEFIDIASHQLRTPVTVIKGVIAMLRDGTIDSFNKGKKTQFYDGAWFKCQKLEDIIEDILNATSLISKKYSVMDKDAEPVNLKEIFERLISGFEPETREREISLTLNPIKKEALILRGQKRYIEEAFSNLITNAIKYTPSPKKTVDIRGVRAGEAKIIINIEKNGENIIVSIKDNGIGIPKEAMPKLFQKFSRAENAVDMYTDGTGLGLFIVREIVEGHGGKVWVKSELGKGSTFFVELPMNPDKKVDIKKYIMEKATAQVIN